jgi:hypothetical protein
MITGQAFVFMSYVCKTLTYKFRSMFQTLVQYLYVLCAEYKDKFINRMSCLAVCVFHLPKY